MGFQGIGEWILFVCVYEVDKFMLTVFYWKLTSVILRLFAVVLTKVWLFFWLVPIALTSLSLLDESTFIGNYDKPMSQ